VEFTYRKTVAAASASGLGLLIGLYDTLAADLRRAAAAERDDDIELRCREVNHALTVIGHLEDWLARGPDGMLAQQLIAFYATLRRRLIEAQVKRSAELLEEQIDEILTLRGVWQGVEFKSGPSGPEILPPIQPQQYAAFYPSDSECRYSRWSA
jgi:flagellar biosynthetic protein FliS